MRTLLLGLLAASAAAAQSTDLVWTGDLDTGSLTGNCNAGQNGWCRQQTIRSGQIQLVQNPVVQGKNAVRFEVKYGDVYPGMSDSRSLMTGPDTLWEDEGSERWYRWQAMWPSDWVGSYPKWDELSNPDARSPAGSIIEWHHDANGGVENGSAPLYIGADDSLIWLCLVDQATSTCRERPNLAPLQRAHWHDFVMHAKWSSDPSIGFLEIWIDGVLVMPKHMTATKYPNMRNYMIAGLYRNVEIGDPNLRYSNGTLVYPAGDGAPGVAYMDGFVAGTTQASVLAEMPFGPQPVDAGAPAPVTPPGAGTPPPATPADAGPATSGEPATAPAQPPPPLVSAADAGTPKIAASGFASTGYPSGGCNTRGAQFAWLAIPAFALLLWRRKRR